MQSFKLLRQSALVLAWGLSSLAWAEPYKAQNVIESALSENTVDFEKVADAIVVLQRFAGSYPTQFDNDEERKLAERDAHEISYLFHVLKDDISPDEPKNYPLFLMKARNGWIAHNLNIEGGREAAANAYAIALALAPEAALPELNEELGRFLSSAAMAEEGEIYLREAYKTRPQSAFPLALNLIAQKKVDEGKALLKTFIEQNPDDAYAKEILDAVEHNRLEFKQESTQSTAAPQTQKPKE